MRKSILLLILLMVSICSYSQSGQQKFSLNQLIDSALLNNENLKQAYLDNDLAKLENKELKSQLLPQIEGYSNLSYSYAIPKAVIPGVIVGQEGNLTVEFGTKYNWNSGLKATQLIYSGSYYTGLKITKEMIRSASLNTEIAKEEVIMGVSQVYYLCQSLNKQISVIGSSMENLVKMESIAKKFSENGFGRDVDVTRVSLEISNLKIEISNINTMLEQQLNLLKFICGMNMSKSIDVVELNTETNPLIPFDESSYKNRPELKLLEQYLKISDLKIRAEKNSLTPTVGLFGEHYYQGMRDKFDFFKSGEKKFAKAGMVGVNISIPIFGGFDKRYKIKKAEISAQQIALKKDGAQNQYKKDYLNAMLDLNNAQKTHNECKKIIEMSAEIYNKTLESYKQQISPLTDLIISENNLTMNKIKYYNAQFQLLNAELQLKKTTGNILKIERNEN